MAQHIYVTNIPLSWVVIGKVAKSIWHLFRCIFSGLWYGVSFVFTILYRLLKCIWLLVIVPVAIWSYNKLAFLFRTRVMPFLRNKFHR